MENKAMQHILESFQENINQTKDFLKELTIFRDVLDDYNSKFQDVQKLSIEITENNTLEQLRSIAVSILEICKQTDVELYDINKGLDVINTRFEKNKALIQKNISNLKEITEKLSLLDNISDNISSLTKTIEKFLNLSLKDTVVQLEERFNQIILEINEFNNNLTNSETKLNDSLINMTKLLASTSESQNLNIYRLERLLKERQEKIIDDNQKIKEKLDLLLKVDNDLSRHLKKLEIDGGDAINLLIDIFNALIDKRVKKFSLK